MRFCAVLGTKDDGDIMPAAIANLRRIGVSQIVIVDYGSTDGTLDVIRQEEAQGDIWLLQPRDEEDDDGNDPWKGSESTLARTSGADWVLFLDADEFWLPAGGSLHGIRDIEQGDILSVPRYNVVLGTDGAVIPADVSSAAYDQVQLYAEPIPDYYAYMIEHPDADWIAGVLEPKPLARAAAVAGLHAGWHDISPAPGHWRRAVAQDVLIAHVPFRSLAQFERKVSNIVAAIEAQPEFYVGSTAWQWSRWARLADEGRTAEEFERQTVSDVELETRRSMGVVRSADEVLRSVIPSITTVAQYEIARRRAQPWIAAAGAACAKLEIDVDSRIHKVAAGSYPTVIVPPGHVVKLYGPWAGGHAALADEARGLDVAARVTGLPIPQLVATGSLDDEWRYLVQTLISGTPLSVVRGDIDSEEMPALADWLGRFVKRLHSAPLEEAERTGASSWFARQMLAQRGELAAIMRANRVLPSHLIDQIDGYLAPTAEMLTSPYNAVLLHADLHDGHVLGHPVEGRFHPSGVIDFNRTCVGHPLYELGPIWSWVLHGDGALMQRFLAASGLPGVGTADFPKLALSWCLVHKGLSQAPIVIPWIGEVATLDELAQRSFGGDEHTTSPGA